MRNWIDICEEWVGNHEHPHREGKDEWFIHGFGIFRTNVDQLKRKIASGEITPMSRTYSVQHMVEKMFPSMTGEFGSHKFENDTGTIDLGGPPVSRNRMKDIPSEKMDEPVLFMMWNSDQAMRMAGYPISEEGREYPTIIDGNHRLIRRYLEGDERNVVAQFVSFQDMLTVTMHQDRLMSDL